MKKYTLSSGFLSFGITSVILNPLLIYAYQLPNPLINIMLTGAGICGIIAGLLIRRIK